MSYSLSKTKAEEAITKARSLIKDYFKKNNLKYAIFGKSEGIDSSVIAGLLSEIEGVKPIAIIMPIKSKPDAERIAKIVLNHYKIPYLRVDLTEEYLNIKEKYYKKGSIIEQLETVIQNDPSAKKRVGDREKYALGNIKARLRMITLYHIAQLTGGVVFSTDNYSEYWMGFWTLNGDIGDLAPIQQVFKGLELYDIAKALGVPEESLNAVPTDGLEVVPNGTDQDQLLLPYRELDEVIVNLLKEDFENKNIDEQENIVRRIATLVGKSEKEVSHVANIMKATYYKRHWPIYFKRQELGLDPIEKITH